MIAHVTLRVHPPPAASLAPAPQVAGASATQADPDPRPLFPAGMPSLEGSQFVADLDRDLHLTAQQHSDMVRVLHHVAAMQERIDRHEDPDERRDMQEKLVHQLVIRLRVILGDERGASMALALIEKQPRIL
jgi:hypothetical protein